MFLHAGLLHLFVNVVVLCQIGPLMERLLGSVGFAALYFAAGIAGSIGSALAHPAAVAVGASGAVFGLYGALGAFIWARRGEIPYHFLRRYRGVTIFFVVFNLIFGLSDSKIDLAAHLGGLGAGFVLGLALNLRPNRAASSLRPSAIRVVACVLLSGVVLAVGASQLTGLVDNYPHELRLLAEVEKQVLEQLRTANGAEEPISDDKLIALMETEVLRPWRVALARFAGLKRVPESHRRQWLQLVQYGTLRLNGWQLYVDGIRDQDEQLIKQSQELLSKTDEMARGFGASPAMP